MVDENTDDQIDEKVVSILGDLAAAWRGSEKVSEKEAIHAKYSGLLNLLVDWGWNSSLPSDYELPDSLMPRSYKQLFDNEKISISPEDQAFLDSVSAGRWGKSG